MFKDIVYYLKKPDISPIYNVSFQKKIKITGSVLLLDVACTLLISIIIAIYILTNKTQIINKWSYINEPVKLTIPFYIIFVRRTLITPIIEEIAFRLMLTTFNTVKIKISISLMIAFAIELIIYNHHRGVSLLLTKVFQNPIVPYGIIIGIAIVIYGITSCFNGIINRLNKYWDQYFYIVFYGCSILFCIGHYYRTPFYFLPVMFVSAILLGYIRVKIGLKYSIIVHMLTNTLLSISMFI